MKVIVDGIIYQHQVFGGISKIYNAILPRMCEMDSTLELSIFHTSKPLQSIPEHASIHQIRLPAIEYFFRPHRYLYKLGYSARMQLAKNYFKNYTNTIWHSTYFTHISEWSGPLLITVYDMIYERYHNIFNQPFDDYIRKQKRKCILNADVVICISNTTKNDVQKYLSVNPEKCIVIPLGCDSIFSVPTKTKVETKQIEPYFLYIGKRNRYKNFSTLINAYSQWNNKNQVRLKIIGDDLWSKEELNIFVKSGINHRIELVHSPSDEHLSQLYYGASALIFPSLFEGFGIPLLEAMNCGCPIIASQIPSTLEVAGEVPIYFDPSRPDELIQAMDTAMEEGRNSSRVDLGFIQAKKYSWDITARNTLEVYRSLK
jgi:glycosyltransferase involved in cell wall biosynthesis